MTRRARLRDLVPDNPPTIDSQGERPTGYNPSSLGRIDSAGERPTHTSNTQSSQGPVLGSSENRRTTELKPGDVVVGRFEVVGVLGSGGMGTVYRVRDRQLGGDKALKVMLPLLLKSKEARDRFRAEVAISQRLRHDGIVAVYDLGADPQRKIYFFTMEFVKGETLHHVLSQAGGRLPMAKVIDLIRQLCSALEYAHISTVHRDLKPQNIMIQPDGRLKILDFGLAKLLSAEQLSRSSGVLGTAYYQAPEQSTRPGPVDQRADIYSLGVIFYQMLTGSIPLGSFKLPSRIAPQVTRTIDRVVSRCLEPDPHHRYRSVNELLAALNGFQRARIPSIKIAAGVAVVAIAAMIWRFSLNPVVSTNENPAGLKFERSEFVNGRPVTRKLSPAEIAVLSSNGSVGVSDAEAARDLSTRQQPPSNVVSASTPESQKETSNNNAAPVVLPWSYRTARTPEAVSIKHIDTSNQDVTDIDFNDSGSVIASCGRDKQIRMWSTDSFELAHTFKGHTDGIYAVAFGPGETILASASGGSTDYTVRTWDLETAEHWRTVPIGGIGNALSFRGDTLYLACAAWSTIRLFDSELKEVATASWSSQHGAINALSWLADSKVLLSAHDEGFIKAWDSEKLTELETFRRNAEGQQMKALAAHPSQADLFASGSTDGSVQLWRTNQTAPIVELKKHKNSVEGLAFSASGKTLISGGVDGLVNFWDTDSHELIGTLQFAGEEVIRLRFSTSGLFLAVATSIGTFKDHKGALHLVRFSAMKTPI